MEAILKFNLPDENHEFHCAVTGAGYQNIIGSILHLFRNYIKYNESLSADQREILETLKKEIIDEIDTYGLLQDFD